MGFVLFPTLVLFPILLVLSRVSSLRVPYPSSLLLFGAVQWPILEGTSDVFFVVLTRQIPILLVGLKMTEILVYRFLLGSGPFALKPPRHPSPTRLLRDQYLDMHRQEAEFVSRYGENHPAVADIRQNLQSLRDASREEMRRPTTTQVDSQKVAGFKSESRAQSRVASMRATARHSRLQPLAL